MSDQPRLSLLDDSLITVRHPDNICVQNTLPEIFVDLSQEKPLSFEALQPHQKQAWYCFLTQTAAMVLDEKNMDHPPEDPQFWKKGLLNLGQSSKETWSLIVEDCSKPAFFQPPIPEGSLEEADFTEELETPDQLDMLITAKNHDLKRTRVRRPQIEHWIFALLNLQTMEGYGGRGNYGIVRMNGGFSNRPFVGVTPDLSLGHRFKRDLAMLQEALNVSRNVEYDQDGHKLLWNIGWDGSKEDQISLQDCHPFFLEVCRRIRFRSSNGENFTCLRTTTRGYRIQGTKELKGVVDDPWVPIDISEPKSLSISSRGYDYERLQDLWLGDDYEQPPSLKFLESEKEGGFLVAMGLARGQNKTEGLFRRIVPVPKHVAQLFSGNDSCKKELGKRSQQRVELAGDVQRGLLFPSLQGLMKAGNDDADTVDVNNYLDRFDEAVDQRFFEDLWASLEKPEDEARADWQETLFDLARNIFDEAINSLPIPSIRRYRAISEAEATFWGTARNILPEALERMEEQSVPPEEDSHRE